MRNKDTCKTQPSTWRNLFPHICSQLLSRAARTPEITATVSLDLSCSLELWQGFLGFICSLCRGFSKCLFSFAQNPRSLGGLGKGFSGFVTMMTKKIFFLHGTLLFKKLHWKQGENGIWQGLLHSLWSLDLALHLTGEIPMKNSRNWLSHPALHILPV